MPMGENTYPTCVKVAQALRNNNKVAVLETNKKSVGSMFKYANKHNFEYAVMIGEEEMNNNQVKIKNLKTQESM